MSFLSHNAKKYGSSPSLPLSSGCIQDSQDLSHGRSTERKESESLHCHTAGSPPINQEYLLCDCERWISAVLSHWKSGVTLLQWTIYRLYPQEANIPECLDWHFRNLFPATGGKRDRSEINLERNLVYNFIRIFKRMIIYFYNYNVYVSAIIFIFTGPAFPLSSYNTTLIFLDPCSLSKNWVTVVLNVGLDNQSQPGLYWDSFPKSKRKAFSFSVGLLTG